MHYSAAFMYFESIIVYIEALIEHVVCEKA